MTALVAAFPKAVAPTPPEASLEAARCGLDAVIERRGNRPRLPHEHAQRMLAWVLATVGDRRAA